jgi:phosphoribosyl-ATP pyrophosphohydrolase/phosphoribosyl-AMP cyclohydrolase
MTPEQIDALAWDKMDGLLPTVVQDHATGQVLMLGYMDRTALEKTLEGGKVTFFSRSKQRLWTKGETSGNTLDLVSVSPDCDSDALLVRAVPNGPTCHLGTTSCFGSEGPTGLAFLAQLSRVVAMRADDPAEESYTAQLLAEGREKIAQKIGEEGVEVALAAVTRDDDGLTDELADLAYHIAVLLQARGLSWDDIGERLRKRHATD